MSPSSSWMLVTAVEIPDSSRPCRLVRCLQPEKRAIDVGNWTCDAGRWDVIERNHENLIDGSTVERKSRLNPAWEEEGADVRRERHYIPWSRALKSHDTDPRLQEIIGDFRLGAWSAPPIKGLENVPHLIHCDTIGLSVIIGPSCFSFFAPTKGKEVGRSPFKDESKTECGRTIPADFVRK